SVDDLEHLDLRKPIFEKMGYEYKGEYGISGRGFCVLYDKLKTKAYVHIHFFQHENPEIDRHLDFRDLLRNSQQAKLSYLNKKKNLIEKENVLRANYSDRKHQIISSLQGTIKV